MPQTRECCPNCLVEKLPNAASGKTSVMGNNFLLEETSPGCTILALRKRLSNDAFSPKNHDFAVIVEVVNIVGQRWNSVLIV